MKFLFPQFVAFCIALSLVNARASVVEYTLKIHESTVAPAGKQVRGMVINDSLPGPILRFREGDIARIHVINGLANEEVSTHWHGLLVPNDQDGVPYITTPPILPGKSHTFEFPLKQSGTYWYHSHTGLQEQRGVYGAIVIEPKAPPRIKVDRDEVLLLSDWTNESPEAVMRTLMRGSDWYAIRKGTAQSIFGAWKAGHLKEYFQREKARLPAMDVSDVAYDAFLINGRQRSSIAAKSGERIRLRVINGGTATYFYLNSAAGPLSIIAADGMEVRPIKQRRLLIGMGETYDLLFTVPSAGSWEFRATAQDGSGAASCFIGTGEEKRAGDIERLNPYSMNAALAAVLDQLDETGSMTDKQALAAESQRPLPPYKRLVSISPTTLPESAPIRRIQLKLSGDMMRYLWTINGTTVTEDSTIPIKRGEVLQMELRNDSMMHHPMHLHGHFFRLLMEDGPNRRFAPLKHTVDVPPMSTRVIEFLANEEKDWVFHCHLLYHMHAGMMKVLSYDGQGADHQPQLNMKEENPFHFMLDGNIQSQMSMGRIGLMDARNDLMAMWEVGWGHDSQGEMESHGGGPMHHHAMPEIEYEIDLTYQRYINPRWMAFGGYRLTNKMEQENSFIAGVMYHLPYMIESTLSVESTGDLRLALRKSFQLTSRFSIFGRATYDTAEDFMWQAGANFTLSKCFDLIASYDSDYGFGGGISFRF